MMMNRDFFVLLLTTIVSFGWAELPMRAVAQEIPDGEAIEFNLDVEGPEFDHESQREMDTPRRPAVAVLGLLIALLVVATASAVVWKLVGKQRNRGATGEPPTSPS